MRKKPEERYEHSKDYSSNNAEVPDSEQEG